MDSALTKRRPLIGISSSEIRVAAHLKQIPESEPPHREVCLGLPYIYAIQQVGGIPVIVAPLNLDMIEPLLDELDGLCLSGGPDLDPKTYGSEPHPKLGPTEYAVDRFELALAREADRRHMPIFAICRGAQILNVARGGTLFQHIPDKVGDTIEHRQHELGHHTTHNVEVLPDTQLAAIGPTELAVNSFHHQAIDELGRNLRASSFSPDGVIESVEATDRDFVIGVQWHAESLTEMLEHEALFRGLVNAAGRPQLADNEREQAA